MNIVLTALAAIFVFCMVILFHEFGHFSVAKFVGIKVHEFAIGMGPKVFSKQKGDTTYSLRLLPIGGYVRMEGEDEHSDDKDSFSQKSVGARMAVILAGAFMNFVLAFLVFTVVFFNKGYFVNTISEVQKDMPAYEAGIQVGDEILKINDVEVKTWNDTLTEIAKANGQEISFVLKRNSEEVNINVTPKKNEELNRYMVGISPSQERSFLGALSESGKFIALIVTSIFGVFGALFKGATDGVQVAGPVGIIGQIGQAAQSSFIDVLFFMGFISVNLGFFNLLPIPALDGSRFLFLLVEKLRGKPVDQDKEAMIHMIGFAILLLLMVVVTGSDIMKLFKG